MKNDYVYILEYYTYEEPDKPLYKIGYINEMRAIKEMELHNDKMELTFVHLVRIKLND